RCLAPRGAERYRRRARREAHLWRTGLPDRLRDLEELGLLEVEHRGDDIGRERLDPPVEVADVAVVEAPSRLQPVLGVGELLLEGEEVLVRLQLRVVLRDREQLTQRGHERS